MEFLSSMLKSGIKVLVLLIMFVLTISMANRIHQYEVTGGELLVNRSFDSDLKSWHKVGDVTTVLDESQRVVQLKSEQSQKIVSIKQTLENIQKGSLVRFVATMKTQDISKGNQAWQVARIIFVAIDENGQSLFNATHALTVRTGTTDWTDASKVFSANSNTSKYSVEIQLVNVTGTAWVKDISLRSVEETRYYRLFHSATVFLWVMVLLWFLASYWSKFCISKRGIVIIVMVILALLGTLTPADLKHDVIDAMKLFMPWIEGEPIFSRVGHFLVYSVISIAVFWKIQSGRLLLTFIGLLILFAMATEILQYLVEGRTPRISDFYVDASGIILGLFISRFFLPRRIHKIHSNISLTEKALSATKWNYLGTVGRIFSQTFAVIILARLLGPEAFGQFAILLLITGVSSIIVDMGLGNALAQKDSLTDEESNTAFSYVVLFSVVFGIFIYLWADFIAKWFDSVELVTVVEGGVYYLLFFSIGIVPSALLKRNLRMKEVQIAQLFSYILGFLFIGLGCALLGVGALSLIYAFIIQAVTYSFLVFWFSGFRPKFKFVKINKLRQFANKVILINLSNWMTENMDNFLIGKLFSMNALGIYSVSYNLLRTPTNHIVVTLQAVLFSTAARSQNDPEKMKKPYLAVISLVALICFPVFLGAACVAKSVVLGLYGEKWVEAISIFVPLALAMPFHALLAVTGPVISGLGEIHREVIVQFWVAVFFIFSIVAASYISMQAVGWAVFITYFFRFFWLAHQANQVFCLKWRDMVGSIRAGLIIASITCLILLLSDWVWNYFYFRASVRLISNIIVGGVTVFFVVNFTRSWLFSEDMKWILDKLRSRLPRSMRWIENYLFPSPHTE